MATIYGKNGKFGIDTLDGNVKGVVRWQEKYDDATYAQTNETTLTVTAFLYRLTEGSPVTLNGQRLSRTFYVGDETDNVAGPISGYSLTGAANVEQSVYNRVYTIKHDEDGSKTLRIGFYMNILGPNYETLGPEYNCFKVNNQFSEDIELTTIPKAPKPTEPVFSKTTVNVNGEDSIAITLKPAVSTHKHKLKYNFGSWPNGQSAGISIGNGFSAQGNTTVTFTPPKNLWERAADEDTICTFRCETYDSSGDYIGCKDTYLYFADVVITPVQSTNWPEGLEDVIVQGQTKLKIEVNRPVVEVLAGAPLLNVFVGGVVSSYEGGRVYESKELVSSGEIAVNVELVESPKNIPIFSENVLVEAYDYPTITEVSARRDVSDDTTLLVTVKGKVSPLANKNDVTLTVVIKKDGKTIAEDTVNPGYDFEHTFTLTGVSSDDTYDGGVSLDDYFWGTDKVFAVGTSEVIMDFHRSGKGIAIGKVSETENLLEVDWDLGIESKAFKRFEWIGKVRRTYDVLDTDSVRDYVIAQGTSGGWRYRKWQSGFAECWGSCSTVGEDLTFPTGIFSSTPSILYSAGASGVVPVYAYGT